MSSPIFIEYDTNDYPTLLDNQKIGRHFGAEKPKKIIKVVFKDSPDNNKMISRAGSDK